MSPEELRAAKYEARKLKAALRELTDVVGLQLAALDVVMRGPSTPQRGEHIARISNVLELANDRALHFDLGMSFTLISKRKAQRERLYRQGVGQGQDGGHSP